MYVYNELPAAARARLEQVLMQDNELAEQCSELLIAKISLDEALTAPRNRVVETVLTYSRSLSL